MGDALAYAAEIMFGEASSSAQLDLRDGHRRLPSVEVLRMARVRLDMCSILFERFLSQKFTYRRCIQMDSSRQFGYDYLLCREDRIAMPCSQSFEPLFRRDFDLNACCESMICPVSIIGVGEVGLVNKSVNVASIFLVGSVGEAAFHKKRCEVRGGATDQGTEAGIGNNTARILTNMSTKYDDG